MFLILEKRKFAAYATLPLSASRNEAGQYGRAEATLPATHLSRYEVN